MNPDMDYNFLLRDIYNALMELDVEDEDFIAQAQELDSTFFDCPQAIYDSLTHCKHALMDAVNDLTIKVESVIKKQRIMREKFNVKE